MNGSRRIGENRLISPLFVFFLIHCSIVGVGVLKFQKEILKPAGYDAWISVLLVGMGVHAIVWMMHSALNASESPADVVQMNKVHFGRWIGTAANAAFVVYFVLGGFVVFRIFLEVIQVWLFPRINIYPLAVVLLLLVYYTVSGGLRTVTGMGFWGTAIPYALTVPLFVFAFKYIHPANLLPIGTHSIADILRSARTMTFPYLGFETMLFLYPFVKRPAESQRWTHAAVGAATIIYVFVMLVTLMYYSEGQLHHIIWPTLNIVMMIEVPIMQRLEYLVVSVWLLKALVNVSICLWAACRGTGQLLPIKRRVSLPLFLGGYLALAFWIRDRQSIDWFANLYSNVGFWIVSGYIPLLFLIVWWKRMRKATKAS
ncbi:spore gernimation protein [Paenibacillus antri]|uniref:Spore gernimation protein n=1 Tax=Paenibacillus antri TaxID=2582848 RepID=A0A5R9G2M5_9BACL|nr:GerAB/ArcD/ProY family transporter [Paenibacillus antri]TLS49269.1 spore gernimation protein [Paenibacillus antri]